MDEPMNNQATNMAPKTDQPMQTKPKTNPLMILAGVVIVVIIAAVAFMGLSHAPAQSTSTVTGTPTTTVYSNTSHVTAAPISNYTNVTPVGDNFGNETSNGNLTASP